ncbi:AAA family ATPase [Coleofasciculus sp. FACHB-712]|uniref:nSTAND1 domain-containing NTPase n=1 Tax=Coleofasciculus sp. FACHB-712 TaxID=2692789 RepID=UPI001682ECEC|nr:AAA family ATPase [Coleofasciculus sp. FACHB-712]MBD1944355.1 AAA family ATPase [Coleofasciculus sp. FACHB-712]
MNRDALVVGINQYPFLKDSPTSKAKHLNTPASDAEAIALRLEEYGGFRVRRLPESIQEEQRRVDPKKLVQGDALHEAIIQLFNPVGDSVPQTALLYFAGHGLRRNLGGVTEGFLATSDSDPRKNQWGVSLRWLRELLQKTPIQQQMVWLDCCYSGELLNFAEADLGTAGQGRTRFFIAAAREFEPAEENIQGEHGVFSQVLWEGLDPRRQPDGVVNNDRLIEYIDQRLKGTPQQPIWYNPNCEIILTGEREEVFVLTPDGICPYKGLRFFDVEDAAYFYGREALSQKLIERVQVGKGNFLAVLGVSGSGKSSLLRAGLMHQLQQERRLPGTEQWKIRIFTPGEQPLVSLATAFLDEEVTDIDRARQLKEAEEAICLRHASANAQGVTGLARLIRASKSPRTVLIVDQFEEVFTVCQSQAERQQFISSLLGALKQTGDKLCLIFAMRDDFLGKCVAYRELADLIQANLVMVTPMNAQELRQAVIEPAKKLGRKVEENLIDAILKDLGVEVEQQTREPEPGMLPLLSYTLEQLWQRQTLNWLKLDSYNKLGGVQKTLENLAEQTYKQLSVEEQRVADQIFIKLTQLGEGTPDTRKQVPQGDLFAQPQSAGLVGRVIQKLVQAKLIVTSEQRKRQEKVAVVDVAHESLIRYWSRLRELLDNNREAIRTERKIQAAAEEWREKEKSKDYLLTGLRLGEAEKFLQDEADIVPLSSLAKEFVEDSHKERDRIQAERDRQRRKTIITLTSFSVVASILALAAGMGWWRTVIAEKNAQLIARSQSSEALFASNKEFDALLESIRTGKQMKREFGINANTEMRVVGALLQSVYSVRERNRFEGYNKQFNLTSFSPDGQTIAAVSEDGSIKIWNIDGTEKTNINLKPNSELSNENYLASSVSFSSKSNTIVAATRDGSIKLWNFDGQELSSFKGNAKDIILTSISRDGTTIAAVNLQGKIKLWKRNGQELQSFQHPLQPGSWVSALSFSSDSNIIASADNSTSGTVKLWSLKGKAPITLKQNWSVSSLSFSPAFKMLASVEELNKAILWDFNGQEIERLDDFYDSFITGVKFSSDGDKVATFGMRDNINLWEWVNGSLRMQEQPLLGHSSIITDVNFSLDSKMLLSVSADKTVRIWNLDEVKQEIFKPVNVSLGDVSFSPDGRTIATVVTGDGSIKLWNLDGTPRKTLAENIPLSRIKINFSSDGKQLVYGGYSNYHIVQVWNIETGESRTIMKQKIQTLAGGKRNDYGQPSFSLDGKTIAVGREDGTVKLLHTDGTEIKSLKGGSKIVRYSPDGKIIASASSDNTVKIWDADGTELRFLAGSSYPITSLSFSPNSKSLVAGNKNGNIIIWSLTGTRFQILQGHTSAVSSLSFRPDGQIFASASGSGTKDDGTIKFWSIDGKEIKSFSTKSPNVYSLNFIANSKILAVHTGSVTMWNLDIDSLLGKGCDWVRNYLKNNSTVKDSDRHLCDGIGTAN